MSFKIVSRRTTAAILLAASVGFAHAIPARRGTVFLEQPDGTTVAATLHGDEYHHFVTRPDGTPLVTDSRGFYVDAPGDPQVFYDAMSDMAERSSRRQNARKRMLPAVHSRAAADGRGYGLFPGTSFPSTGSPNALVLLVEYSDVKFTLPDPHDYFSRMVNEEGFSDYGGTGSALDFFTQNSSGQFTPKFDVVGPVTLANPQAYYGGNLSNGDDARAYMMAVEGCRMLDAQIDFSKYDNDGDGVIDNVFVFFAGQAESSTGVADQVWPHTGFISYSSPVPVKFDGVALDRYACSNEWEMPRGNIQGPGRPDGVGTFVHEFSHVMGLPDLYSTKYNNAFTPGTWSALDYGPYNNNGCTPPNYSVFERYALGWLQPRQITGAANVRLEEISHNQAAMIPTLKDTEFFLFENRQQTGWDKYIPGHGMLVWHIDYNDEVWTYNAVNNTVAHQYVDIEEADGMATDETRADDAFPSSLGRTNFNDNTIPSMLPWTGRSVGLPISDITERPDGVITFKVAGGRPDVAIPVAAEATDITPDGFTASWTPSDEPQCRYALSVYTRSGAGSSAIVYAQGYNHLDVGSVTQYKVTGLRTDTQYYYTVSTLVAAGESEPSEEVAVRTAPPTFDFLAPQILDADRITGDSFTARWEPLAGATEYFLYVTTPAEAGHRHTVCGFDGGIASMPDGWTTDATSTYSIAANCGASTPSLRFSRSGQNLTIAEFADGIHALSFWMRGISTADNDGVTVEALTQTGKWVEAARFTATKTPGGATVTCDNIPAGAKAMRITADNTKGSSIAIDDVDVAHGTAYAPVPVDGYNGLPAGNTTSCTVTGLAPLTQYSYYVTASDGTLTSLPSQTVTLTTTDDTGIGNAPVSAVAMRVAGRTVTVTGATGATAIRPDGRTAASGKADSNGHTTLLLPSAGMYIITADGKTINKTIIK